MSYATIQQLTERYGESALRMMTDPDAQSINTPAAQQALDDASEEINFWISKRYVLPLATTLQTDAPAAESVVLVRCCCDIAAYRLQTLRTADDIKDARQRYEDALKLLKSIAQGEALLPFQLVRVDAPDSQGAAGVPVFGQPPSLFGRGER